MRLIALSCGISVALLAPLSAAAEDSANLKVTGVISPASCSVSLGGTSTVDLGEVKVSDFKPGEDLALDSKSASLAVICEGASARFRLKARDTSVGGGVSVVGLNHYSLGWNESGKGTPKPNGYFKLSIDTDAMQSNKYVLKSTDGGDGKAWGVPTTGEVGFDHDGEAFAFAASGSATQPADLESLTVPLKISAVLAKDPVVNGKVELAGQATIEIFY